MRAHVQLTRLWPLSHDAPLSRAPPTPLTPLLPRGGCSQRADTLKKAEDTGVIIKAPRGNRSQWHANFKLDEFATTTRDVPVVQPDATSGDVLLRGCLVLGPGHTLADVCKMILTELQMAPTSWWELRAISPEGRTLAVLHKLPVATELLPCIPDGAMLLVGRCDPPRFVTNHAGSKFLREQPQIVLTAEQFARAVDADA